MKTTRKCLAFLLLATAAASATPAAQFRFVADQGTYSNVIPNQPVSVQLYLAEQSGGSQPTLADMQGLFAFGLKVASADAEAPTISSISANPAFDGTVSKSLAGGTLVADHADVAGELLSGELVLLGTFTLTAANAGLYHFAITDNNSSPSITSTVTADGTELDGLIQSGAFNVSVVPEPTAALSLGGAGAAMLLRRRRR